MHSKSKTPSVKEGAFFMLVLQHVHIKKISWPAFFKR